MSTLVLTEVFPPRTGGSGRWLWELYRRVPAITGGGRAVVMAGRCDGDEAFDRTQDVEIHRAPLTFPSWGVVGVGALHRYWRIYRRAAKLMREHGLGAVHCGRCLPEGAVAWLLKRKRGAPYAVFVHGEELNTVATSRELSLLTRHVFGDATVLIANSHNTAAQLRRRWVVPAQRIEVLHPGVDTALFTPAPRDHTWRGAHGWNDRPVILTVGRLQKRKGHHLLIGALPRICAAAPDVLYAIVGDGERRAALQQQVNRLGLRNHVQFLGERADDELVRCFQQCDLFALPNVEIAGDFEGFGMVLVEAQSCGKPVIAGDSGGTRETMGGGVTGRIVDCTDIEALAGAVSELLTDRGRAAEMGGAARRWASSQFDWQVQARRAARMFATRFAESSSVTEAPLREAA